MRFHSVFGENISQLLLDSNGATFDFQKTDHEKLFASGCQKNHTSAIRDSSRWKFGGTSHTAESMAVWPVLMLLFMLHCNKGIVWLYERNSVLSF